MVVLATTGMVADLAREVFGSDAAVSSLLNPTMDPHSYTPTPSDVRALQKADLVVANGLRLEGKMEETFLSMRKQGRSVVLLGEGVPREKLLTSEDSAEASAADNHADPHLWGDLSLWADAATGMALAAGEIYPEKKEGWTKRAADYAARLLKHHEAIRLAAGEIPESQRVLVTSHDAFRYFGRAYGFTVRGAQGLSTASEAGLRDMADLTRFIKERQLPAIFVETSVSPVLIERLAKDSGAKIGGKLFSDALGAAGDVVSLPDGSTLPTETVAGMQWANLLTIMKAFQK